jgi:hypothetical protein
MNKKLLIKSLERMTIMYLQKCEEVELRLKEQSLLSEQNALIQNKLGEVCEIAEKEKADRSSTNLTGDERERMRNSFEKLASDHGLNVDKTFSYSYLDSKTQLTYEFFHHGKNAILAIRA